MLQRIWGRLQLRLGDEEGIEDIEEQQLKKENEI